MGVLTGVPTIDLSQVVANLKGNNDQVGNLKLHEAVTKVVQELKEACINWGFFYIIGHGIEPHLMEELKKVALDFFYKPDEFKKRIQNTNDNFRGYCDTELTKQKLDLKQVFDYGVDMPHRQGFDAGVNRWPEGMPEFKETLLKYFSEMQDLSVMLINLLLLSLEVDPSTMRDHFIETKNRSICRINYYPPVKDPKDLLGVGPHTDPGMLTVLLQDDHVVSLQVEKDGEYHAIPPIPGSFVINIGDMVQVWSNGLYKAPLHRVISNPTNERFSVPFFFNPSYDCNVEPLAPCITTDRPKQYRSLNYGHFLGTRYMGNYADHGEEIQIQHFEIKSK